MMRGLRVPSRTLSTALSTPRCFRQSMIREVPGLCLVLRIAHLLAVGIVALDATGLALDDVALIDVLQVALWMAISSGRR